MVKRTIKAVVKYKPLSAENDSAFKTERSLDTMTFSGSYLVEITHNGTDVGLPIDDCGEEHYIVGTLVVTDSGTGGRKQKNRVIGQALTITSRQSKNTKVYTRTFAGGEWSQWRSLAVTGMYNNISTPDELLATVESLVTENTRAKEVEESVKRTAVDLSSLACTADNENVTITGKSMGGEVVNSIKIPAATTEKAGVMSAENKRTLHNIDSRLGFNNETIVFKADDLLPMTWDGTKMVSSTNFNVWIVPLNEGREYKSVFLSFLNSRRTCSEYPVLGKELSMSAVSDSFKATSEMKYIVVTVDMRIYDGSDYEISASGHGLLEKFENLVPLVNETNNLAADTQKLMSLHIREAYACIGSKERTYVLTSDGYDNIIWNGTKFVSATSSKYNGFVVPIYPGERIKCLVDVYANNMRTITEYPTDGSSNFVRTRSELGDEFIVQENEHYLFINNYVPKFTNYKVICGIGSINSQLDDFRQSQYPLYGKTIVCFGDSLTEGNGDDGKGYADYLAELTQANIIRGGVGGTQLATRKEVVETPTDYLEAYGAVDISNLVKAWANKDWTAVDNAIAWLTENRNDNNSNQIEKLKANPIENTDIVIVFGGSNDCANGTFGAPNDTNPVMNTCGGINQIIYSILSVKPDMPIYFFTPIPRMVIDTWCDDYRTDQSDAHGSLSFPSLVKRIKECVEHNHIPCCDMYNAIGINRKNIYTYADDGVHPNHGYSMLANKMYSFIMANRNWQ